MFCTSKVPALYAYHGFVTAEDLFGDDLPAVKEATLASIPTWAQLAIEASSNSDLNITAITYLLTLQHDLLFNKDVRLAELLQAGIAGSEVKGSQTWMLFGFSRGSMHLGSTDDINEPLFDPRVFLADFDFETCTAAANMGREYWMAESMSDFVTGIAPPLDEEFPEHATDEQWEAFTRSGGWSSPVPTSSRLPYCEVSEVQKLTRSTCIHAHWAHGRHAIDDVEGTRGSGGSGAEGVRHRQCPRH